MGGVDFETSRDALQQNSKEIQAELTNIRHLGCLENLFTFNGQGHEISKFINVILLTPSFISWIRWFFC